jgi:AcrR family transcriptional regulator
LTSFPIIAWFFVLFWTAVAAREIALKEGWHSVTIRKIADAIEYTLPIVYEHFESKEKLINELILSGFRMMNTQFIEISKLESDPKIMLKKLSLLHRDFAFANRELYQLMFSLERPSPNEEIIEGFTRIKNLFMTLANNDKAYAEEIMFNWICLVQGAISTIMRFKEHHHFENDGRDFFVKFIDRFIRAL